MTDEYLFNMVPKAVPAVETRHRKICTRLPVPESLEILNRSRKYEPWSMNHQLNAVWEKAVDYQVYDQWGNIWIDFSSGIFVTNTGHGNRKMVNILREFLEKPLLSNYYYPSEIRSLLAEKMVSIAPENMDKVLFLTTGAETTECALKLCRLHGRKMAENKVGMLSFAGAFHGKTLGAQTMAGKPAAQRWIGKMDPYIFHLPCPTNPLAPMEEIYDEERGRKKFREDICALEREGVDLDSIAGAIFEPYQGWAALFYNIGYIKALRAFLDEKKALLVSDEVQSGFGRTGRLFGFEHYDVNVDIICCGKAVSGALPLSAVLSRKEILDVDSSLNSTHGGSPLPVASSLANIEYLQENRLVQEAARKGVIVKECMDEWKRLFPERIKAVHGMGLAYAAIAVKPGTEELDIEFVDRVIERAFEKGLMSIRTMTGTIKVGPPLTIPDDALREGFQVLTESISEIIEEER